jgi:hypothetical protein
MLYRKGKRGKDMKSIKKVLAMALALAMVVTAVPVTSTQAATTATLSKSSVRIAKGSSKAQTSTVTVTTPSTWKSVKVTATVANKKVATAKVSGKKVTFTAVKKGTTTATIKVTGKKSKKAVSKTFKNFKVTVVSASLSLTAPTEVVAGSTTDLAVKSVPKAATLTYETTDASIAEVTDGKLVAKKAGTVGITVNSNYGPAKVFVVKVTALNTVKSVEVVNGGEIKVTFNEKVVAPSPVRLGTDIIITAGTGAAGTTNTSGSLSKDGLTYTITSTTALKGEYVVETTTALKNDAGDAFEASKTTIKVEDTTAPTVVKESYSPDGKTFYVEYSEAIASTGSAVVSRVDGVATTSTFTVGRKDAKTLQIAISGSTTDENKDLKAVVTGVTDLAGNAAAAQTFSIKYDTTEVDQATITSITRTALKEMEIKFSAALETAPTSVVVGTYTANTAIAFKVDDNGDEDRSVVVVSDLDENATGNQLVTVSGWKAYKTTSKPAGSAVKTINFTYTKQAAPVITGITYVPATTGTTATSAHYVVSYDSEIMFAAGPSSVTHASGVTSSVYTVVSKLSDGTRNTETSVTEISHVGNTTSTTATKATSSKLILSSMPAVEGTYTITVPAGIVTNKDGVGNVATTISVAVGSLSSTGALPAPTKVLQSATDTSVVTVAFANKLDETSAETTSNYNLIGGSVSSATLTENNTNGAVVTLKVSVPATGDYVLSITGVKGYNGSYGVMDAYTKTFSGMKDTVAPTITASLKSTKEILVTFSEAVTCDATASADTLELQAGTAKLYLKSDDPISGKTATFKVYSDAACTTPADVNATSAAGVIVAGANVKNLVDSTGVNYVSISSTGVALN